MEIRFKREINHNYMIIKAPEAADSYECRMLAGNSIEGLLKFRVRTYEENREFYYEITSRQPLSRLLEQRKLSGGEIRKLLLTILGVLNRIEEYLFREEELLLDPQYIYVDPDCFSACLCLIPGFTCDLPEALSALLKVLLERVDHQDKEGVVMAYNLYQESLKENYGVGNLLRQLMPENDKIFITDEKPVSQEAYREDSSIQIPEEKPSVLQTEARREQSRTRSGDYESNDTGETNSAKTNRNLQKSNTKKERGKENPYIKPSKAMWPRILIAGAAAEIIIWYTMGEEGVRTYGIWAAAAILMAAVLAALAEKYLPGKSSRKGIHKAEDRTDPTWVNREQKTEIEIISPFEVKTESQEEYYKRMRTEEQISQNREEGTVLLATLDRPGNLAVLEGINKETGTVEIPYVPFIIGKHPDLADYCLQSQTISRLHLRIDRKEETFIATDLNSTNGTTVNGYALQANETVSIKNGDIIFLADVGYKLIEIRIV